MGHDAEDAAAGGDNPSVWQALGATMNNVHALRQGRRQGNGVALADLAGMIFRATEDRMSLLWIGGLGLGVAVIALAAICENHRDRVLARIRTLSAALATWE